MICVIQQLFYTPFSTPVQLTTGGCLLFCWLLFCALLGWFLFYASDKLIFILFYLFILVSDFLVVAVVVIII